jgi:uncharacterized damage-inducible protein DinB
MAIRDAFLHEYDHEMATTRRLLERVPEQHLAWKPHEKSMTLGQLAGHLSSLPHWASAVLGAPFFDLATGGDMRPKEPASRDALLKQFDEQVATARKLLANCGDAEMLARWSLKRGSEELFTMPRITALRSFVMNHTIHHRGQLSVYLRMQNVPVPPIYGPSADEA